MDASAVSCHMRSPGCSVVSYAMLSVFTNFVVQVGIPGLEDRARALPPLKSIALSPGKPASLTMQMMLQSLQVLHAWRAAARGQAAKCT